MIRKMMELSTAHMPSSAPDWGKLTADEVLENDVGFVVFVTDPSYGHCPPWLQPIMQKADDDGCVLILFDRDADPQEDLFPLFEW